MYNKTYTFLSWISDFVLLNILWFFCSLPLITIFPSTASLYYAFKKRKQGNETNVFRDFFEGVRLFGIKSIVGGLIIIVAASILYLDVLFFEKLFSMPLLVVFALIIIIAFFVSAFTIFYFPTLVGNAKTSILKIFKKTLYSILSEPLILVKSYCIIISLVILINLAPIFIFIGGVSLACYSLVLVYFK